MNQSISHLFIFARPPPETAPAEENARQVKRKKRGRRPVPLQARPIAPPLHLRRVLNAHLMDLSGNDAHHRPHDGLTEEEVVAEWRYRRSRDLNNVASKRHREQRLLRERQLDAELEQLERKNRRLKRRHDGLEDRLRRLKKFNLIQTGSGDGHFNPARLETMWCLEDPNNRLIKMAGESSEG